MSRSPSGRRSKRSRPSRSSRRNAAGEARELVLPGNVEAFYTASIHAQVSGYVQEWRKDIGAKVRQGDVLAVIDTPELDQSISVAESELARAKANLALAKVTAERWNSLRASAAVSQQTADEKTAEARARAAEVDAAEASLNRLKAQKAFAKIVAPFDGVVTARNIDVGSLVRADAANGTELFAVSDVHQMRIYVPVPETYAAEMKDGMKATLRTARVPRPQVRCDDRHDLARDRPEVPHSAGRTPRRQQGRRSLPGRLYARAFPDPA